MFDVIIAASGQSTRTHSKINKLLMPLYGRTVLENSILPFLKFDNLNKIIIATSDSIYDEVCKIGNSFSDKIIIVKGGDFRTESVKNALNFVTADYVLIHDGARPFITSDIIKNILTEFKNSGAIVPVVPMEDTLCCTSNGFNIVDRDLYAKIQTPQGFKSSEIKSAYSKVNCNFTDDSAVYKKFIGNVNTVKGSKNNRKITTLEDLQLPICRSGIGFDTHQLVSGRKLIIGGLEIPHNKGLLGHSDADVLTHAVMDAILSALGERDIGIQFPDTDNKYKNISSMILLDKVLDITNNSGYSIYNLSATILAEKPKLKDYIPQICDIYKNKFNINENQIGISATTTEKIGDIGQELAISAMATVTLIKN